MTYKKRRAPNEMPRLLRILDCCPKNNQNLGTYFI